MVTDISMANSKLPTRNVVIISLLGGGVLLFLLLSIFPNYLAYSNIIHEIDSLQNQIEEQKLLSPIFSDLTEKTKFKDPKDLPFPQKARLSKNDTGNLAAIIQKIIQQNDFNLISILTDVGGLLEDSGTLKVSIEMTGNFMNLRNLLLQLGALPYLEHIEFVRIDSYSETQQFQLKIWIAQEQ
jgi:hypothetical protein